MVTGPVLSLVSGRVTEAVRFPSASAAANARLWAARFSSGPSWPGIPCIIPAITKTATLTSVRKMSSRCSGGDACMGTRWNCYREKSVLFEKIPQENGSAQDVRHAPAHGVAVSDTPTECQGRACIQSSTAARNSSSKASRPCWAPFTAYFSCRKPTSRAGTALLRLFEPAGVSPWCHECPSANLDRREGWLSV